MAFLTETQRFFHIYFFNGFVRSTPIIIPGASYCLDANFLCEKAEEQFGRVEDAVRTSSFYFLLLQRLRHKPKYQLKLKN